MLSISDIRTGSRLVIDDEPYEVVSAAHNKQARGGAILKMKLKNLATGSVIAETFQGKDSAPEADLSTSQAQFLYREGTQVYFMDTKTYDQFSLSTAQLGQKADFLVEGTEVNILNFQDEPINIDLPIKLALEVIETPPGIKGDTASGGTKMAKMNTGITLAVPLFIKEGDKVLVDTRDGSYVERA